MLTDMFGSEGISKMIRNNMVTVTVDEKIATVNVDSLVRLNEHCVKGEGPIVS